MQRFRKRRRFFACRRELAAELTQLIMDKVQPKVGETVAGAAEETEDES